MKHLASVWLWTNVLFAALSTAVKFTLEKWTGQPPDVDQEELLFNLRPFLTRGNT